MSHLKAVAEIARRSNSAATVRVYVHLIEGGDASPAAISKALHLSRDTVWKSLASLREMGAPGRAGAVEDERPVERARYSVDAEQLSDEAPGRAGALAPLNNTTLDVEEGEIRKSTLDSSTDVSASINSKRSASLFDTGPKKSDPANAPSRRANPDAARFFGRIGPLFWDRVDEWWVFVNDAGDVEPLDENSGYWGRLRNGHTDAELRSTLDAARNVWSQYVEGRWARDSNPSVSAKLQNWVKREGKTPDVSTKDDGPNGPGTRIGRYGRPTLPRV